MLVPRISAFEASNYLFSFLS